MTPASDLGRAGRILQRLTWTICRLLLRVEIEHRQRLATQGPTVVVFNHLSVADGPLLAALLPRKGVFLIAREFDRTPILNWWIRTLASPIYIDRGVPDRRAVTRARAVLNADGMLCLAPEGRVSRTGGLAQAERGAAFVANAASAQVVPVAIHGQEKFWRQWLRLRRPRVRVVVGEPFTLPHDRSRDNTDFMMRKIAELLPPGYRGIYRR